ncbi:DUF3179 domain-containing protein [Halomicrobium katesii]|uniref:DUF3179 domain-containing protein n=1 Tax=Halomicrobium katesii TaxID=437163 RepID=UPI00036F2EF4|nr:DUF3179 domain-containing protein [Halomicrobium katesii]
MEIQDVLPRDAIPSVDDPSFAASYFGEPEDEVVVVESDNGAARAYPIRILSYHEIVNDTVDGRPIAVTWCPICWSAVVYDRRIDGQTLTFGVSGKLADDALVLYDQETDSEWKQPTGMAITGELAGRQLEALSAPIISWEQFRTRYPNGVVLQAARGPGDGTESALRDTYDMNPYDRYAASDEFGLYGMRGTGAKRSWDRSDLDPKTLVLGVERGGDAVGYPRPRVAAAGGAVTDTVGGDSIVVVAIDDGMHAFEDTGLRFEIRDGELFADGAPWDVTTGKSDDGRRLTRIPSRRLFAFAWQDAYGPDSFYASVGER